jgi:hypothetical protein
MILLCHNHEETIGGRPADLFTDQAVLGPRVHGHTSKALPVGIEAASPQTQAIALTTTPQKEFHVIRLKVWPRGSKFGPEAQGLAQRLKDGPEAEE